MQISGTVDRSITESQRRFLSLQALLGLLFLGFARRGPRGYLHLQLVMRQPKPAVGVAIVACVF